MSRAPEWTRSAESTSGASCPPRRPTVLPVPAFALKVVLGEFAQDTLASQRIVPGVLERTGFSWEQPDVASMIRAAESVKRLRNA